jgi:hypothetical protein
MFHAVCLQIIPKINRFLVGFMVFITTFNNIAVISWWSVLLVEETAPRENHGPVASHWQSINIYNIN